MNPKKINCWRHIPKTVWALGFVSLFMDISSEMIHSLLPVFLVTVLGSSAIYIGLMEGVAEAAALIVKMFSGVLSDRLGKRKLPALIGYALGALSKPLFAMASGINLVFTARFIDRMGKGIRGAPRDALIADVTPADTRGAAYGLRQSLDTVGAFIGPLLSIFLMALTGGSFRTVFWFAVVPGLFSVAILFFTVQETASQNPGLYTRSVSFHSIASLSAAYWVIVTFGAVFILARFSEAFLLLRAQTVGMPVGIIPILMIFMNIVYSLTAYPAGFLSDRIGRTGLMTLGLGALIVSDLIMAAADNGWMVSVGTVFWGLHMGLTQGLLAAMVADTAPREMMGTAFGVFNLLSGFAMLAASIIAGCLWEVFGAPFTFMAGAVFATLALLGFATFKKPLLITTIKG